MFAARVAGSLGPAEEVVVRGLRVAAGAGFERATSDDEAARLQDEVLPAVGEPAVRAGARGALRHGEQDFGGGGAGGVEPLEENGTGGRRSGEARVGGGGGVREGLGFVVGGEVLRRCSSDGHLVGGDLGPALPEAGAGVGREDSGNRRASAGSVRMARPRPDGIGSGAARGAKGHERDREKVGRRLDWQGDVVRPNVRSSPCSKGVVEVG